ncbi:MAG: cupin domain-containing protein [Candidatus Thermoplasmatota archaeon]|nr:cupin domain-containing protein [Candidatus Thermoplasmatota archaeon]MBU1941831.1 cupin domain-containing protein [Candidatus Thermoplasmatota archaeon]
MKLITLPIITSALQEALGISYETAKQYAMQILDIFGFEDRIIDNILDQVERQFFYILEGKGLLTTDGEEITLHTGRKWRIRYWCLRKPQIQQLFVQNKHHKSRLSSSKLSSFTTEQLYTQLSTEIWANRKTNQ